MHSWTIHGGKLATARSVYPGAPEPWLDLSTGINPHAWPGAATVAIDWRALPDDDDLTALEAAAAVHFGVDARFVCALPGTEIGLRLLDHLPLPRPAFHVIPGYRTHGEAVSGSVAVGVEQLKDIGARGGTILLANPNNPDGRLIPPAELHSFIAPESWLVVDESFADACPHASVAEHVADDVRLLVLRSFGKFFGLAGVRLGFAIGPDAILRVLRRQIGSWPVSTAAIRIGAAAYRDTAWIEGMRETLASDAATLDALLRRHGFDPIGDCPLFQLIEAPDARALFDRLACRGILTRPFDHDPRWLRFGLPGSAAALDRLDEALAGD